MNEYQEMILQAEELDKLGKFAEADQLMQKTAFGLAEVMPAIRKYGPEVMKFVRKYGPQGVEVYRAWKSQQQPHPAEQPQLSAPTNEVPGEFVPPTGEPQPSAPEIINSPLTPQQGNRRQHPVADDFNKVVRNFKQQLQKALTDLEYYKDIDEEKSQTAQDSRERTRAHGRMKAFDRLIQNINFNSKKAIELAYNFMKYQVGSKQADVNSKKQVFAYTTQDLGALGITRKNTSLKGLAEGGSLEHWQQTFLKPIFDGFFQKVNDLATTHGQDPSKQISIKGQEQSHPVPTKEAPALQDERFPSGRNTGRWPDSADPYRDLIETPYAARPGKGY